MADEADDSCSDPSCSSCAELKEVCGSLSKIEIFGVRMKYVSVTFCHACENCEAEISSK